MLDGAALIRMMLDLEELGRSRHVRRLHKDANPSATSAPKSTRLTGGQGASIDPMSGKMVHRNSRVGDVPTPGDLDPCLIDNMRLDLHCLADQKKQAAAQHHERDYWDDLLVLEAHAPPNGWRLSGAAVLWSSQTDEFL